jgi:hypothetical protein
MTATPRKVNSEDPGNRLPESPRSLAADEEWLAT